MIKGRGMFVKGKHVNIQIQDIHFGSCLYVYWYVFGMVTLVELYSLCWIDYCNFLKKYNVFSIEISVEFS